MNAKLLDFPTRLRVAVAVLGNQTSAAERIGVSQARLSNYIRAVNQPPAEVLEDLAAESGVRLEWLAEGTGPVLEGTPAAEAPPDASRLTDGLLLDELRARLKRDPELVGLVRVLVSPPAGPVAAPAAAEPAPEEEPLLISREDFLELKPVRRDEYVPVAASVAAGAAFQWNEDAFPPQDAEEYVHCEGAARGTFAMRVEGKSMQKDYPQGSIVLFGGPIQPGKVGKPALAVYTDEGGEKRYTLKLVSARGNTVQMRPTNGAFFDTIEIPRDRLLRLFAVNGTVRPC